MAVHRLCCVIIGEKFSAYKIWWHIEQQSNVIRSIDDDIIYRGALIYCVWCEKFFQWFGELCFEWNGINKRQQQTQTKEQKTTQSPQKSLSIVSRLANMLSVCACVCLRESCGLFENCNVRTFASGKWWWCKGIYQRWSGFVWHCHRNRNRTKKCVLCVRVMIIQVLVLSEPISLFSLVQTVSIASITYCYGKLWQR